MKKKLLVILLSIFVCFPMLSGCLDGFSTGAIAGVSAITAIEVAKQQADEREAQLIVERQVALDVYEQATDELGKQYALIKLKQVEKELQETELMKRLLDLTESGMKTNWNDPNSVANYFQTGGIGALIYFLLRKKKED